MCIDISCEILYNAEMLSQEDIQIITDIVFTQISPIKELQQRIDKLTIETERIDKIDDSFHATFQLLVDNDNRINRIYEYLKIGLWEKSKKPQKEKLSA